MVKIKIPYNTAAIGATISQGGVTKPDCGAPRPTKLAGEVRKVLVIKHLEINLEVKRIANYCRY
jgi:hypothetical protein